MHSGEVRGKKLTRRLAREIVHTYIEHAPRLLFRREPGSFTQDPRVTAHSLGQCAHVLPEMSISLIPCLLKQTP